MVAEAVIKKIAQLQFPIRKPGHWSIRYEVKTVGPGRASANHIPMSDRPPPPLPTPTTQNHNTELIATITMKIENATALYEKKAHQQKKSSGMCTI